MKIRKGFVSNSSSSNFIVNDDNYETVFDLTKEMLHIRDLNTIQWHGEGQLQYSTEAKEIERAINTGKDKNSDITFSSCNYNTFIKKVGHYYVITTCNNNSFKQDLQGVINMPEEIYVWLRSNGYWSEDDGIDSWNFQCGEIFWDPKNDIEFSRYDYMEDVDSDGKMANGYCKKNGHHSELVIFAKTGEKICPTCYAEKKENRYFALDERDFGLLDL